MAGQRYLHQLIQVQNVLHRRRAAGQEWLGCKAHEGGYYGAKVREVRRKSDRHELRLDALEGAAASRDYAYTMLDAMNVPFHWHFSIWVKILLSVLDTRSLLPCHRQT